MQADWLNPKFVIFNLLKYIWIFETAKTNCIKFPNVSLRYSLWSFWQNKLWSIIITLWLLTLSKELKTIVTLSHAGINDRFYFWSAGIVNQYPSFAIFQSELYHPHTDKERENESSFVLGQFWKCFTIVKNYDIRMSCHALWNIPCRELLIRDKIWFSKVQKPLFLLYTILGQSKENWCQPLGTRS